MTHALEGAWAKLDRARHHARDLQQLLSPLVHGQGHRFVKQTDGTPTKLVFYAEHIPEVRPEISQTFGDFLTNVRAALDHLAWQLAPEAVRATSPRKVRFPILESAQDSKGKPAPAQILGVTDPDIIRAVEEVQPYSKPEGPERDWNALRILNGLCNIDKHRTLLVAVVALEHRGIWWGADDGDAPVVHLELWPGPLRSGDPAIRFDFGDRAPEPGFDPNLEIQVRLIENLPRWSSQSIDILSLTRMLYWEVEFGVLGMHFAPLLGAPVRHQMDVLHP